MPSTRRVSWSVVVGAIIGALIGGAWFVHRQPTTTATAAVELTSLTAVADLSAVGGKGNIVTVDTDAQLLQSDEVVDAAAHAAVRSRTQARLSLSITARPLTRVLEIGYVDPSPTAAVAGAQNAAQAFLALRERVTIAPAREYLARVTAATLPEVPTPPAADGTDAVTVSDEESRVEQAIATELRLQGPGVVLERARVTAAHDRGQVSVPLASGSALGALLGVGVAVLRRRRPGRPVSAKTPPAEIIAVRGYARPIALPHTRALSSRGPTMLVAVGALVGGCSAVGLAGGYAAATQISVSATGRASMFIKPLPGNAFDMRSRDDLVDLQTEAQVVLSNAVIDRAAAHVGYGKPDTLRPRLGVSVVAQSEVLQVSVRAPSVQQAKTVAAAVVDATLDERQRRTAAVLGGQRALLQGQVDSVTQVLKSSPAAGTNAALNQRLVFLSNEQIQVPIAAPEAGALVENVGLPASRARAMRLAVKIGSMVGGAAVGLLIVRRRRRPRLPPGRRLSTRRWTWPRRVGLRLVALRAVQGARPRPSRDARA